MTFMAAKITDTQSINQCLCFVYRSLCSRDLVTLLYLLHGGAELLVQLLQLAQVFLREPLDEDVARVIARAVASGSPAALLCLPSRLDLHVP